VKAQFYVEAWCMDCDNCRELAPLNFERDDTLGRSYVYKQPESPGEQELCEKAVEECPALAIAITSTGKNDEPKLDRNRSAR
jgi:ferredoxin